MNKSTTELNEQVKQTRRDIVRMVHEVQSGHPGGSLGCTEFFTVLFQNILRHNSDNFNMSAKDEDVFVLSNGHISPVYYSALAHSGYFPVSELKTFRKLNTRLQGHPTTHEGLPGVRIASGSLGQGLSVAAGITQAKKLDNEDKLVYVLMGDGELQEGQIWEAVMYAAHNKLDNLIATVDVNGRQIDGDTKDIMGFTELKSKFEAFDWNVISMNGNDIEDVQDTLSKAGLLSGNGKPICILMQTEMGNGVDFMMGSHKWHGIPPNDEQLASALEQNPSTIGDY
ncbi:MAG: transketolase [Bacteroidia bacterium]|nr:transketolase [Bacteroidia bacterium]MDG2041632.1 transketolase [Bacteroidia bacterium]|tara:strand:- start:13312 stop:14160 length:849 start_codon:yes stop_codon:yes gene_type:complete